jgi:8-oxo-dGTP pyrophosphatase MutT (NUDIX family)
MTVLDQITALRKACLTSAAPSSDFDLNPDVQLPPGRVLRPAAVLVAFQTGPAGLELVLTKRSSKLKHHPGQIAFPGGKVDAEDEDLKSTALREAREEVGLASEGVEILGHLQPHETVTSFQVTPVVALIHDPFTPVSEPGEVEETFFVPFDHVTDPQNFSIQGRRWRGQRRHYYTAPFGPYYIWGATARILRGLADRIHE